MQTNTKKLVRVARKRGGEWKSSDNSLNLSALKPNFEASSSLTLKDMSLLNRPNEKDALDLVFDSLRVSAHQELTRLLRDLRSGSESGWPDGVDNRRIRGLLMRAVRCATKQYMLQTELSNLAFKDELTGFYNRRAFQALAERQLKLAQRSGRGLLLFFLDVDCLKHINDSFGHAEGDRVLRRTADILRQTFRDSDVIARLGGDEFAVLAIEAEGHCEGTIAARLNECLRIANAGEELYAISISVGVARFDYEKPNSIRELMERADHAMYAQKRSKSVACVLAVAGH